jgi:hypothetical protein
MSFFNRKGRTTMDDSHDGCEVDFTHGPTADDDIDGVVLFAGVPADEVDAHRQALLEVLA